MIAHSVSISFSPPPPLLLLLLLFAVVVVVVVGSARSRQECLQHVGTSAKEHFNVLFISGQATRQSAVKKGEKSGSILFKD